ncbi:hypothetical protein ACTXG7_08860 [Mycolicibacterium sp. Dal123E01]|uniref:hypothetical protein n=1 Tax=Mycolicibacterium sp. Dal123E01 TaxID=3457578 RepID=UPI00403EB54F
MYSTSRNHPPTVAGSEARAGAVGVVGVFDAAVATADRALLMRSVSAATGLVVAGRLLAGSVAMPRGELGESLVVVVFGAFVPAVGRLGPAPVDEPEDPEWESVGAADATSVLA